MVKDYKSSQGISLVESIVGLALIGIVFWGVIGMYIFTVKVVTQSKLRSTAIFLANQRIEEVRSLSYDNIGTIGGVPSGNIPQEEEKNYNDARFTIKTTIVYIDDPSDGLSPTDEVPTDYKRVEVRVSWQGENTGEVMFVTNIVPSTVEENVNGGILSINVKDANSDPVGNAEVHIYNDNVDPLIDADYLTNDQGRLVLVGMPESVEGYQITVTKTGYSVDRTYGRDEVANPAKPHASVFKNETTDISFSIDLLGNMNIETTGSKESGYPSIGNVEFELRGNKVIGTDEDGDPVYKFDRIFQTNSEGSIEISSIEWDSYNFFIKSPQGLDLTSIESPPGEEIDQPIDLLPGQTREVRLILEAQNSLLVKVYDASTGDPIFSASVHLYNGSGYDNTTPTGSNGESFFTPINAGSYHIEVEMDGYNSYSDDIDISGDVTKTVNLQPI